MIDIERISPKAHRMAVYGEITPDDTAKFVAFAKAQNEAGEGGNILIDMVSMAGFSWAAVAEELAHVPALMQWLYRLDRIALVADEGWIRSMARLESALLPGVVYAVYDADEAEAARAWVLEESNRPHSGAVQARDKGTDVVVIELTGRLDRTEAENGLDLVRARLDMSGARKLMVVVRKWHGFDPDAALSTHVMQGKIELLARLDRYALVGGPGWLRQMADTFGPLVKPEVRSFADGEDAAALAWLRG
ncbi:STAS/SEC14 domain-containing protein [Erythrobacter sp. sf7]|uniref:STAS/SEC14 domain-containing protein n=1 Tax=Erythrobacter fulvus TaxID=2987523 RepID=A0ABT5JND1_9SPHN|nr:STAS/SEC14 domain-containing protein [Erythrobacter fulvus]MDC8753643.1 STAS/SEC14 domain-containing protein [Erythrobacter fulvus]